MKKVYWFITLVSILYTDCIIAQETFNGDRETYDLLKGLSDSKLATGQILLFTTTHEDIAWLDEPEVCKVNRDKMWLTPFMERLKSNPDFKMDIEQSSIVMEYLHRHPEEKENFINLLEEGRICIGGAYVQPYEGMYSGESVARQFYLGKKWMQDNLGGYQAKSYFNVDVPGRTMQMPQLAHKAGIENFIISRYIKGLYNWESPDGSKVHCYSPPQHYMHFYSILAKPDAEAIKEMVQDAFPWYNTYNDKADKGKAVMPAMLNYEFLWDQKPVENAVRFTNKWNEIKYIKTDREKRIGVRLPNFTYATADEFMEKVGETTHIQKTVKGERPNTWVYIHGASHQRAIKVSREGDILITQAEKFATANAMLQGSFKDYPQKELNEAWMAKIYPDHGWGGKEGDITDNVFLQKFLFARQKATAILDRSLLDIAGKIEFDPKAGRPVVVFNSLSWKRSDPIQFTVQFDPKEAKYISVFSEKGDFIPVQLSGTKYYSNGNLKSTEVEFMAENIPSIGYRTYYLKPNPNKEAVFNTIEKETYENKFYKVTFGNGGLSGIYDKELGLQLIDSTKFKAGEIFEMSSIGNGAGEFSEVQQPDMGFFERLGGRKTNWEVDETGPVFTSFKMRQKMKEAVIEEKVIFYNASKKIDFRIALLNWDGVHYREFRMAMPLNMKRGEVTYEVPFGAVTVGKDEVKGTGGEMYNTLVKEIRPRAIENWISASGNGLGITLSSSVVTADWIDPTDSLNTQTILQPILLASRKSCHSEGNEYLQTGDHYYSFSLTSHKPGWKKGQRFGKESNEKLQVVIDPKAHKNASLPRSLSFFGTNRGNLVISTVKKAEDDASTIIRIYDTDGEDTDASIAVFKPMNSAQLTNLIEEPSGNLKITKQNVQLKIGHNSIETIKIH